jgi:hypothetical protein
LEPDLGHGLGAGSQFQSLPRYHSKFYKIFHINHYQTSEIMSLTLQSPGWTSSLEDLWELQDKDGNKVEMNDALKK